jgi:hypothetical protein
MRIPIREIACIAVLVVGGTATLRAVDQRQGRTDKAAWQWTLDERLAARFDEASRKARVAEAMSKRRQERTATGVRTNAPDEQAENDPVDVIHGSAHPELLLPSEIFTIFMRDAYGHEDEVARNFRADAAAKAREAGLPEDFLEVLETESANFVELQRREEALRDRLSTVGAERAGLMEQIHALMRSECPLRAGAIDRLRARYGKEPIDRYLYTAIAPGVSKDFFGRVPDRAALRADEEGCR